jgi:serine/threonine-protein kinase RsbW
LADLCEIDVNGYWETRLRPFEAQRVHPGRDLSIKVSAQSDKIADIREAVGRRATELGADRRVVDDLRTVVSEACNNVVLHAYPEDAGERPLEVLLGQRQDDLQLVVRDQGKGLQPSPSARPPGLRMGLLLMGAMSSCLQLRGRQGRGTELVLRIPLHLSSRV